MDCIIFLSDFRNLNKQLKHNPYPIPNMRGMLLNLEGFRYATLLDLNMGYYHIRLSKEARNLCAIILSWVKYKYKRLPMGRCNSLDIFQDKMNKMFSGMGFIRAYIDDLLVITKCDWSDHLDKLELLIKNLRVNGLK